MSYDLNLFRKRNNKKPFSKTEISNKLADHFGYIKEHVKGAEVAGFDVGHKEGGDIIKFFYNQEEGGGYYWTYCSYGVDDKTFKNFKKLVKDVAEKLDLQIQDVQVSEDLMDPDEFVLDDNESGGKFRYTKKVAQKIAEMLQ